MGYASQTGRARTSRTSPEAHAICDRCGFRFNHVDLSWQHAWRGPMLTNIRILVCNRCMDTPNEQLRAIVVPADPTPIINARVENFEIDSTDFRAVAHAPMFDPWVGIPVDPNDLRTTQDCKNRTMIPYGEPDGLTQPAIPPQMGVKKYGVPLAVLSVYAIGCTVTVTCSAVHNLQPDYQVSIEGLTAGNGFFSVQVPTATMFTYQTVKPISPQMTPGTRIVTASVGLPLGFTDLPLPGVS